MSNKQLARLAAVLVLALALWGVVALTRHAGRDVADGLPLPKIDTAAVDTIAITSGGDSALLVRRPDGHWRVNGFPAATANVDRLLRALNDTLNWSELAAEQRSSQAAMGVTADSGRHVRVVAGGSAGLDLITGHSTSDYAGVYARPAGDSVVYALHGPLTAAMNHPLDDWRDKTIASVPPDSVRRVEVTHGRRTYALVRSGTSWRLASGKAADSAAVQRLLGQFHPVSATGFAKPAQADSANFERPTARVRLFGTGRSPLADVLFDSASANVLVRADTGTTVYLMGSWMLDQVAPAERTLEASTPRVE